MIYDLGRKQMVSVLLRHPKQLSNLFEQDAGRKVFHSLQRVPDIGLQQMKQPFSTISAVRRRPNICMAAAMVV